MYDLATNITTNSTNVLKVNETGCIVTSTEDLKQLNNITFWVEGIGIVSLSLIGITFNLLAIVVLSVRKSMQNMFNYLLICLFCADTAFLLLNITSSTLNILLLSDYLYFVMFPYLIYPFYRMIFINFQSYLEKH